MTLNEMIISLCILILHYIADFLLQTAEEANNKHTDMYALLGHTITYSTIWAIVSIPVAFISGNYLFLFFSPITFILHTITDYITSRINKKLYDEKKYRKFFNMIGFDQILHYLQLFLTFYLLQ